MSKVPKNILVLVAVATAFGLLAWLGKPSSQTAGPAPQSAAPQELSALAAAETEFEFGTVSMAQGPVNHVFIVKNEGVLPVKITRMYTSCMCTEASLLQNGKRFGPFGMPGHGALPAVNREVAPREEILIDVTFDPAAHGPAGIGLTEREVFIATADGGQLVLVIRANVIP